MLQYCVTAKVDSYVKVDLDPETVQECSGGRNVFRHKDDLVLDPAMKFSYGPVKKK